jgi:hypothetical protein
VDMARKKWEAKTEITPGLIQFRAKRKWQIALRRYVLQHHPSTYYAPFFALDIRTLRAWFENQFENGMCWDNFGEEWQFDHVIPVAYFDFEDDADLKLCWNFTNLRVEPLETNGNRGRRIDVIAARAYFKELHYKTEYPPCLRLLEKIERIEVSELKNSQRQLDFVLQHREYIEMLEDYSPFEFELLNSGRTIEDVNKEIALLKKLSS